MDRSEINLYKVELESGGIEQIRNDFINNFNKKFDEVVQMREEENSIVSLEFLITYKDAKANFTLKF